MKTSTRSLIILLVVLFAVVGVGIFAVYLSQDNEIDSTEFYDNLYSGQYVSVSYAGDTVTATEADSDYDIVYLHNDSGTHYWAIFNYSTGLSLSKNEGATDDEWSAYVASTFDSYGIVISATQDEFATFSDFTLKQNDRYATSLYDYIYPIFMIGMVVILGVFLFKSMRSSGNVASNFGKSKANVTSSLKVRFSDVAGAEEEKEELAEIVEFLRAPAKFTSVGAKIPRGVLLVGPPGTGKTLFAKAVAGEANVPFFSISGSDFVEMFVGVGASRVRDLFEQAKKSQPCIIFVDEIDAVGRQRGAGLGGGNDEREQTLNQLLVQMDGFETNENIIIIAATNRADILDPALLRPGRFDRQVYVNVPDVRGREAIFKVHSRNKPMSGDMNFQTLARMTSGFTGADIANLLNESAILCARAGRTQIIMEDIYEGIDKIVMGTQKKSRLITEVDKRITAYHEGGHAIVAKKLAPNVDPVHEISIIPRGRAAGYTMMRPDNDNDHITYNRLTANIAMAMGGRVAEEIVIKDISAGASGDIKHATDIARKMVTEWGMSNEIGPVYYGGSQEVFLGRDYGSSHSYSEALAGDIDKEISKLIKNGHDTATKILTENRAMLDVLVRVLFEKETIYGDEFDMIMEGKSADEVISYIDSRLDRKAGNYKSTTAKQTDIEKPNRGTDDNEE